MAEVDTNPPVEESGDLTPPKNDQRSPSPSKKSSSSSSSRPASPYSSPNNSPRDIPFHTEEELDFISDPEQLNVVGLSSFYKATHYIGNLYHENHEDRQNSVDFSSVLKESGFAYVADTTGHRYESELQLGKKKELEQLWKEFEEDLNNRLFAKMKKEKKIQWAAYRWEMYECLRTVNSKIMEIGKSSTFCGILVVWVTNSRYKRVGPQPVAMVIQAGDSAIFRFRYLKRRGYRCEPLTVQGPPQNAAIGGDIKSMRIMISTVRSGDVFLLTTDGLHDHFCKDQLRRPKSDDQVELLDISLSHLLQEVVTDMLIKDRKRDYKKKVTLKTVYTALIEYAKDCSRLKLDAKVMREADLDDVGFAVAVANFFDENCPFLNLVNPELHPPIQQPPMSRSKWQKLRNPHPKEEDKEKTSSAEICRDSFESQEEEGWRTGDEEEEAEIQREDKEEKEKGKEKEKEEEEENDEEKDKEKEKEKDNEEEKEEKEEEKKEEKKDEGKEDDEGAGGVEVEVDESIGDD